jgi:serine/threonine-protein kinase RsbW
MSAAAGTARRLAGTDFLAPELGPSARGGGPEHAGRASPSSLDTGRASPSSLDTGRPSSRPAGTGPGGGSSQPAVATAWRVFAAQPLQVACARRFIAGVLADLRAADDVVLCVSELASNAVLHSSSREPGGHFVVRARVSAAGRIRAEVEDRGGPWACDGGPDEEHGRGLLIVGGLATRWGITGSDAGRIAWLELDPA